MKITIFWLRDFFWDMDLNEIYRDTYFFNNFIA